MIAITHGRCPVCRRMIPLAADGRLKAHRNFTVPRNTHAALCRGWYRDPLPGSVHTCRPETAERK